MIRILGIVFVGLLLVIVTWRIAASNPSSISSGVPKTKDAGQITDRPGSTNNSPPAKPSEPLLTLNTEDNSGPAVQGERRWPRFDLSKLRQAMLEGDLDRFRDVNGTMEREDAADLHSMLLEIPTGLPEEKREAFKYRLIDLLGGIPGDESSSFLHDFIGREGVTEQRSWLNAVMFLGSRRYAAAAPFLETRAFGKDHMGQVGACSALLLINPAQYVMRTAQEMQTTSNPYAVTRYLSALRNVSAGPASLDIGEAVPGLQSLFRTRGGEARNNRPLIADALVAYVTKHKSEATKTWLLTELRSVVASREEIYSVAELAAYREILAQLEK